MQTFTVLYHEAGSSGFDDPLAFVCEAEGHDHAEEQCLDAYPNCDVVTVEDTDDVGEALERYYFEMSQYDADDFDGQPDEMQEWHDFDPDC